jgi:hypothetical protein
LSLAPEVVADNLHHLILEEQLEAVAEDHQEYLDYQQVVVEDHNQPLVLEELFQEKQEDLPDLVEMEEQVLEVLVHQEVLDLDLVAPAV